MNFYKRYIGDIQRDTGHLSCAEMGVYDRLLDHYYATEHPLSADIDSCCRIARAMTKDERKAVASILSQYFVLTDDGYIQNRTEKEIAEAQPKIAAAKTNGMLGGRPKGTKNKTQEKPNGFPNKNPTGTQHESSPEPEPDKPSVIVKNTQIETSLPEGTPAGRVCAELVKLQVQGINPSNPTLLALIQAGADPDEFCNAAKAAIEKGKPQFNYIIGIVKRQREEAANLNLHQGKMPKANDQTWRFDDAQIMAKARELSIHTPGKSKFEILAAIDKKEGRA